MIGVTNNSPTQINAALIALKGEVKNEVKNEIIEKTKIEQIESDVIDDNVISQDKTWSSDKISSMLGTTYPEGYVYQQLYFPAVTIGGKSYPADWGKTPIELGMTPASGCKWEEFTSAFSTYSYLKIGTKTAQNGHNKYHRHTINMLMYAEGSSNLGYSVGWDNRRYQPDEIKTDYEGDVNEQTVEVNASGMKIWKVVADT